MEETADAGQRVRTGDAGEKVNDEDFARRRRLRKSYGGRQVVKGVTLQIEQGEVVGLLGAEWRGKDNQLLHDCGSSCGRMRVRCWRDGHDT